jgi:hypothetical protein
MRDSFGLHKRKAAPERFAGFGARGQIRDLLVWRRRQAFIGRKAHAPGGAVGDGAGRVETSAALSKRRDPAGGRFQLRKFHVECKSITHDLAYQDEFLKHRETCTQLYKDCLLQSLF